MYVLSMYYVYTMNNRFVEPIESIDIFSTQNGQEMKEEDLSCLEFDYVADEIKLRW